MEIITDTKTLADLCRALAKQSFITIDTEFIRERTYFSNLCLIQVAGDTQEAIIDPLAQDMDLTPLLDLLSNEKILKVFHAAYQDMEIFYHLMDGKLPTPIFDSQIAAMVCGLGDNVGYAKLVNHYCKVQLDKGSRFTDWARRPLTEKQLTYAIADVTYLRDIYKTMRNELTSKNRLSWVTQELATLQNPKTYELQPQEAWRKVKMRGVKPKALAIAQTVAAWREEKAIAQNKPRPRILNDHILTEIATHPPKTAKDLEKMRGMSKDFAHGKVGQEILKAVEIGLATPKEQWPSVPKRKDIPSSAEAKMDILRLALKLRAREHGVVPRLIANDQDLAAVAMGDEDTPLHEGWRWEIFGKDAYGLMNGNEAIAVKNGKISFVEVKNA